MLRYKFYLIILLIQSGCHTAGVKKNATIISQPGMTVLDVLWNEGVPDTIQAGLNETHLFYGENDLVIRKGRLSHKSSGGTFALLLDGIAANALKSPRSYFIALDETKAKDIYYQYYQKALATSISLAGNRVFDDPKLAEAIVTFDFDMIKQRDSKIDSELIPVNNYSWTSNYGNAVSNQKNSGNANVYSSSFQHQSSISGTGTGRGHLNLYGQAHTVSTSYQQRIFSKTEISYDRTLVVNATSKDKSVQIWRLTINSSGSTSDPRLNFAALLAGGIDFFGKDSSGQFHYFVMANDPKISLIQGQQHALDHYVEGVKDPLIGSIDFRAHIKKPQFNRFGDTVGTIAAKVGSEDLLEALFQAGMSPNVTDRYGKPMLAFAVELENPSLVRFLMAKGADPYKTFEIAFGGERRSYSVFSYSQENRREMYTIINSMLSVNRTPATQNSNAVSK